MNQKIILVTGASSTIGKSLLPQLLAEGYSVIAQVRQPTSELLKVAASSNNRLHLVSVDLRSNTLGPVVSEALANRREALAGLIHLPSAPLKLEPLPRVTLNDFSNHIEVSLYSLHALISIFWKDIRKSEDFRIVAVNTAAIHTQLPPKGMTPYLTSKAALTQYLSCIEAELLGCNVTINQISPDMFRSPLIDALPSYIVDQFAGSETENLDNTNLIHPESDIVPVIIFLMSSKARKITGQNIRIARKLVQ